VPRKPKIFDTQKGNPHRHDTTLKIEVQTLTNGRYDEFPELAETTYVGSAVYDVYKKRIIGFVRRDTLYGEANLEPEVVSRWLSTDPIHHPYQSPYVGFDNNPVYYVDPNGTTVHTEVKKLANGTFEVTGGQANSDRNIYVVDGEGKRTGETIGKSLTEYSFFSEKGEAVKGAIIDPWDKSGVDFMNKDIIKPELGVYEYAKNATGWKKYDFKTNKLPLVLSKVEQNKRKYRGMPFEGIDHFGDQDPGAVTFASARDIGNVGAGYVAGRNGWPWPSTRKAFDGLQTWQDKGKIRASEPSTWWSQEGKPTQQAQTIGHTAGIKVFNDTKLKYSDFFR
jgi:hypothetical protein